jgi:cytochrome bd ubiquinol oxidase subunit I
MDVVWLSRMQFAVATLFHFLFVPLTLGLGFIVAIMETIYVRTGDEEYKAMAKYWGKIFLINFVVGVVTGLTLEFQFGTNWAQYSKYVGDIFGSLLAIEATLSFFLESTFIGIWLFGWNRISPKLHAACIWLVALAANLSAFWILVANSWMQHPVGYVLRGGRAELVDFWAVLTQSFAILTFFHVTFAGYIVGGFFVMGVSAYHILRKSHISFFTKSFKIAVVLTLVFSVGEVIVGDIHGEKMALAQPAKLAAVESQWETEKGAPFALWRVPDPANERNSTDAFLLPKVLSFIVYRSWDAEIKGLKEWPKEDRPPVTPVFWSFRLMVALGFLFPVLALIGFLKRNNLESIPWYLKILPYSIPLPYLAAEFGWTVTEVGRQPWIVYNVMRTKDAVSNIEASQVAVSLVAFIGLYSLLGLIAFVLIARVAKRGPGEPAPAGE